MMKYIFIGIVIYVIIGIALNFWHTLRCRPCRSYLNGTREWTLFVALCMVIGLPWAMIQAYAKFKGLEGECE